MATLIVSIQLQTFQMPWGEGKKSVIVFDLQNAKQLMSPMLFEFHILSQYPGTV